MAELIAPAGIPEQRSFEVDSHTFYANPFGVTVIGDESEYAKGQDVGLKPESQVFSDPEYLTLRTSLKPSVGSTPGEKEGFGIWAYLSLEPQVLQNVAYQVTGHDQNKILENQYTRAYTWGE